MTADDTTIHGPDPRELFDRGLELFARGQVEESVAVLREAFFGNLFLAPALLGTPAAPHGCWFPGPSGSPEAAQEYVREKRAAWQHVPNALRYLRCLWDDPLVKREIRGYGNFCKSFSRSQQSSDKLTAELMAERAKFTNKRRIRSTQEEILERIRQFSLNVPPPAPQLAVIRVEDADPKGLAAFVERVLGLTPEYNRTGASWIVPFRGSALHIVSGDTPPGGEIVLEVKNFDYYVRRLEDEGITPAASQTEVRRDAYLLIEAPGGLRLRLVDRGEETW